MGESGYKAERTSAVLGIARQETTAAASSSRTDVMEDARKKLVNYIPLDGGARGLYRAGELARRYFMKPSIYKIGQTLRT